MRSSRITKLILSLLMYACLLQANETPTTETIFVTEGASRHYLTLQYSTNEIILQDLKQGEAYKIFIASQDSSCQPILEGASSRNGLVLEFTAIRSEQIIKINQPCSKAIDATFSITSISDQSRRSSRNMMGILVDEFYTPERLIQDVFIGGDCFDVEEQSISYRGSLEASAFFAGGSSSINIEEGVLLSTGDVHNSAGPNAAYNTGTSFLNFGADEDLRTMINSSAMYDVAALEFDFTPTTDQISFDFVFASEEYCEYAGSSFNDAFGFFISGPGINGPFANGAENIAIVPGTNLYTSINNVNHIDNPGYYVNNIPTVQHNEIPLAIRCDDYPILDNGVAISEIEYDGFTTVMTAMANVQACETYHIKLVIADVSDGLFDSAVFLKANSFSAGALASVRTEAAGGVNANTAYETCEDGYFVFERIGEDLTEPMVVNYNISNLSTALAGVDYVALPDSVVIPAGDSVYYLPVTVFEDAFVEGAESIILELDAPCTCDLSYSELLIEDVDELSITSEDIFLCDPTNTTLAPNVTGGWGAYNYAWSTGATTETLDVFIDGSTSYTLTATDECGNSASATTNVAIVDPPTATISGNELICLDNPRAQLLVQFTGVGPWEISYTIDNVLQPVLTNIQDNPYWLETTEQGTFELVSVRNFDCVGTVAGTATVGPTMLDISFATTEETCPDAADASIAIVPDGGTMPYMYAWEDDIGNTFQTQNLTNLSAGTYSLTLTDARGCSMTTAILVTLNPNVPVANAGLNQTLDCNSPTVNLTGTASMGSNFSYLWTTTDGNIIADATSLTPLVDQPGTYMLSVLNLTTSCVARSETEVLLDNNAPVAAIEVLGPLVLTCTDITTVLDASASMPFGNLEFSWTSTDGNILSGANTVNPEVDAEGMYELEVTNTLNGCKDVETVFIDSDITLPTIAIEPASMLTCIDSVVMIDANNSSSGLNYTILWTTSDGNITSDGNTLSPSVDQPGTYELTIFNTSNDCSNTTSVLVAEDRILPIADAGLPTELNCNDDFVILNAGNSSEGTNYAYEWSTSNGVIQSGISSLNPEVTIVGTYSLLVTNTQNGCFNSDEVEVFENPDVPNAADVEILAPECFGDLGAIAIPVVYGGQGPYLYSIDDGESFFNENIFINLEPGNFNVLIQDAEGCLHEESVNIPNVPELTVELLAEAEINLGDTYQLNAWVSIPTNNLDTIIWTPDASLDCVDCLDPLAFPLETTKYRVIVTDENGCPAFAEMQLRVNKDRKIFIPNTFSPNGDGTNDDFMIYAKEGQVTNIATFQIFNRWGGKVFEVSDAMPNDSFFAWDGTVKGQTVNSSVFIYYAEIEFIDGEKIMYKGDVTVTN